MLPLPALRRAYDLFVPNAGARNVMLFGFPELLVKTSRVAPLSLRESLRIVLVPILSPVR